MRHITLILFIVIMSTTAFAQKMTVVVGAVGDDPKPGLRKALETQIKAAFVKDGRYTAVTREEAVLSAVDSEQAHQRTGAVDDNEIRQIGKQSGARYVCVVEIAPLINTYTLTAQFVDIESANIVNIASVPSQLRNSGDFLTASEELVRRLLGYAEAPTAAQKVNMKYIAVIETQVDTQAIAAKEIKRHDLREITSVLRREAVKNLPRDKFNVMTSETVQSMGTAMLKDCIDENCIITIGSKIGADYIVRGTLSKAGTRLSLTVEIFETGYGNLVAVTPEPIRTADINELFDKSSSGSAAMYRSFVETNTPTQAVPQAPTQAAPQAPSQDNIGRQLLTLAGVIPQAAVKPVSVSMYGEFTDRRDGKKYKTVEIGRQTWMAENLNYQTNNSWCYGNDVSNCNKYGRLYTWNAARTACPSGWHLPSDTEWDILVNYAGWPSTAGTKLKSSIGWQSYFGIPNGTDEYGFSALPGGSRLPNGSFDHAGYYGGWWSATNYNASHAWSRDITFSTNGVRRFNGNKKDVISVRCLKD